MKHRRAFNRLDRKPSHRRSLHNNMVTALLRHGRIRTTKAKALEVRRTAERMITRARVDTVHNRRMLARRIHDRAVLAKLFGAIAETFRARPGGYTRLLKLGPRYGDAAEMVILELLADSEAPETGKERETEAPAPNDAAEPEADDEPPASAAADEQAAETNTGADVDAAGGSEKAD